MNKTILAALAIAFLASPAFAGGDQTTLGGGAPVANGGIPCHTELDVTVVTKSNKSLQKVQLQIPPRFGGTVLDMYFDKPQDGTKLWIGGDVVRVGLCDTPLNGGTVKSGFQVAFDDQGKASVFLPVLNGGGLLLNLSAPDGYFHQAAYTGQKELRFQ